tara:strand:- start:11281 stop:11637 length:357 start_codon:yes stop_codon:yes gene_type:complete
VIALLWLAAGTGLMFALAQLPSRLDTMLFFSTALGNITMGLMKLGTGVLQVTGALVLLALVVLSLMLLVGGLMRLLRAFGGEAPAAIQARQQQLPLRRQQRRQRTAGAATSYLLQQKS